MLKTKLVRLLFFMIPFFCISQNLESINNYTAKYPNSDLVRLVNETKIEVFLEDDQIKIKQTSTEENLFLNTSAFQHAKESVSYSSFYELEKIEATSFENVNGKYVKQKVTDFKEKDELNSSFYDDLKSVNFRYPNLKKGSKSRLFIIENIKNPRFLNAFYFGGYYPILKSKLVISVDKKVELEFKEFNMDSLNFSFHKKEKKNKIIYTWEAKDISKIEMENATPNYRNYYPHVIPRIKSHRNKNGSKIKYLEGVEDLYNWYYSLVKGINKKPLNNELKTLVDELVKNKKTELEKVRAIYYWVQDHVKYIANEYALGGFVPREANDVFIKKYGDCKDNSSILYEMLKAAKIQGHLTWIGTRDLPYKYEELPTPAVDNHMILAYKNKEKIYLLDATGRFIPLELPSSFIQGKEALIGKGEGDFEIYKVPVIPAVFNQEIDSTFIRIDGAAIKGKSKMSYSGYAKINLFSRLESLTSKETKDFYVEKLRKGSNKCLLSDIKELNKYSYDKDFDVNYNFILSDYILENGDEIYVDLNLVKVMSEGKIDKKRKTDLEIKNKGISFYFVEFDIPNGYKVDYIPEDATEDIGFASGYIKYKLIGNKIQYEHKLVADFLILKKEMQVAYNKMAKEIEKSYKEVVVLKKIK